ncbi:MAG: hypothetical protein CO061_02630 [Candidatus Yonathbacteria bacterium CG_4_9_14_0_2_um_filter_47_74]|uniref:Magnesium transporter CorA n=2 Tax=Parcubacteria group TaxID=1794811 RepID=A0A1J4VEY2_9BACT|nr:MAG: hypothetical protein AUJ44_01630 [Candidatus Nomurabacteria bacterium CG1_02_47_685]PIP03597.1 MAG: hypothetical protein COX54_03120 [Candidatus Yonathbacteria bacterium CG23_combo_of_CG06-09_8_20_14_all_46_18]PIQ31418.1 MAG: hypothetical protein COW61_03855 [Candidatus Yonathbacteria bacterium CG17_big_fil_post_rev_8_21_14_2_50_46_19]PIY57523.1 MAG: hypothetical protein COY99_02820 [Candidatus Yonathbacteria bacterium CG_4_10_14_0_8_um_filter_47_645]PJC20435.1 MAG: hypothetical protein
MKSHWVIISNYPLVVKQTRGYNQNMISRYTHKNLTWVDIESPDKEEVRGIMEEYHVHPIVADELLSPTLRPKVDIYENCIYLILHFPTVIHKHNGKSEQEVDFVIGKNFIITTHYDLVDPLHDFSKVFEVNSILDKSNISEHAGYLFFYLMRELYKNLIEELDTVSNMLDDIERQIFNGNEIKMVKVISGAARNLLNFKQAIRHHKEVLESFELAGEKFFGSEFSYYLRAITGEYYKINNMLDGHKETLAELRDTNDSLLTTKTNEIMKNLTILAFVTFPLSLLAAIFGMKTEHTPLVGGSFDFWIIIGVMVAATFAMLSFFKHKKWIE